MFTKENLEWGWNEVVTDCKIREADMSQPTEIFLTKALSAYLRKFGYKVDAPSLTSDTNDNGREQRLFQIKLAQNIDHILKITDKSYSFTYYDLIKPTPKKTFHMLGILLNYFYYFNKYKADVFNMANEPIKERQDLLMHINQAKQDNVQRLQKAEKLRQTIDDIRKDLPKQKSEVEALETRKAEEVECLQAAKKTQQELETKLNELKLQRTHVRKQKVLDSEAHYLESQLVELQHKSVACEELKNATDDALRKHTDSIDALQKLIKEIHVAKEIFPLEMIKSIREIEKKLEITKADIDAVQKNDLQSTIVKQQQVLQSIEKKLQIKVNDSEQKSADELKIIAEIQKRIEANRIQLIRLQQEEHASHCALEEQQDISKYLQESLTEFVKMYTSSDLNKYPPN